MQSGAKMRIERASITVTAGRAARADISLPVEDPR